jgi:hypothetical protein
MGKVTGQVLCSYVAFDCDYVRHRLRRIDERCQNDVSLNRTGHSVSKASCNFR